MGRLDLSVCTEKPASGLSGYLVEWSNPNEIRAAGNNTLYPYGDASPFTTRLRNDPCTLPCP